jgi:hypothetical protein
MKKTWITLATLAVAAIGLSACGGTTDTAAGPGTTAAPTTTAAISTTSGSTPGTQASGPKGAFITQADAVCVDLNKKTAALAIDLNASNTADIAKQADAIDQSVTLAETAIGQLKALTSPPGDETTVAAFWTAITQQIATEKEVGADIRANNLQAAQTATKQAKTAGQQNNAQMAAYGFVACAK